jgi:hypothetical protein
MQEFILSILIISGAYIGSTVFAIALFKLFFPLKSKPINEHKLTFSYSKNKSIHSSAKDKVRLLSGDGRRVWVKISS